MSINQIAFLSFIFLPFIALMPQLMRFEGPGYLPLGALQSIARLILLMYFSFKLSGEAEPLLLKLPLIVEYPVGLELMLDVRRIGFLFSLELCFLLVYWFRFPESKISTFLYHTLLLPFQALCTLYCLSENIVVTGAIHMLLGVLAFYLVRFSCQNKKYELGLEVSARVYSWSALIGLATMCWGVYEFGAGGIHLGDKGGKGAILWAITLVLAAPVPFWSKWLLRTIHFMPEGIAIPLVALQGAVILKLSSFYYVYPSFGGWPKLLLAFVGLSGSIFYLVWIFLSKTRKSMLSKMPGFYFCLVLLSIGISHERALLSAYFACLFVPIFTVLILYASNLELQSLADRFFLGLFFFVIFGLPGSPVFLIFGELGARSLAIGSSTILGFFFLWLAYFGASAHIAREAVLSESTQEGDWLSGFRTLPVPFSFIGFFLLVFLLVLTQMAWRFL